MVLEGANSDWLLAVNDFEHFLSADKGLSVSTREC